MKVLTQAEAKRALARLAELRALPQLDLSQACEAVELLDKLAYSYNIASRGKPNRAEIMSAVRDLEKAKEQLCHTYDICPATYIPEHACGCTEDWEPTPP